MGRAKMAKFDANSNEYTASINKKIRNVNKKLSKIAALQAKKESELNDDQKASISRKPDLLAELEMYTSIQNDLIKVHLTAEKTGTETIEEEVVSAPDISASVTAICKLNFVARGPHFANEASVQNVQNQLALAGLTVDINALFGIKTLANLLAGYDQTSFETMSHVAVQYASQSDEIEQSYTNVSFAQLNSII